MTDQAANWKIHVKKGSYEVEVEGPSPERVEKMFDELVKKYMKKIASPRHHSFFLVFKRARPASFALKEQP